MRLLVIEDDVTLRESLSRKLEEGGFAVEQPLPVAINVGHRDVDAGLLPEETECPQLTPRHAGQFDLGVFDQQGRVEVDVAERPAGAGADKIDSAGQGGPAAGLQLLAEQIRAETRHEKERGE